MFKKSGHKRYGSSPIFVLFRFLLSLVIFAILLGGIYSAYRHFSGFDPIKLDPEALLSNTFSKEKILDLILGILQSNEEENIVSSSKPNQNIPADELNSQDSKPVQARNAKALFQFAIIADSHSENQLLVKALQQAKTYGDIKFVIGLGDYTEVGTLKELQDAKKAFDETGIRYFVTSGDHDLWDARDKQRESSSNFIQTFGRSYQSFSYGNSRFILLDNSDNYTGMGSDQISWLKAELERIKSDREVSSILVFAHEPLYHPSSDRVMGKVTPALKNEAEEVLRILAETGVQHIFAGDIHFFTQYQEPETGLSMTTIGAVTSQRNPQAPRYGIVTVLDDGSIKVEDIEIK